MLLAFAHLVLTMQAPYRGKYQVQSMDTHTLTHALACERVRTLFLPANMPQKHTRANGPSTNKMQYLYQRGACTHAAHAHACKRAIVYL